MFIFTLFIAFAVCVSGFQWTSNIEARLPLHLQRTYESSLSSLSVFHPKKAPITVLSSSREGGYNSYDNKNRAPGGSPAANNKKKKAKVVPPPPPTTVRTTRRPANAPYKLLVPRITTTTAYGKMVPPPPRRANPQPVDRKRGKLFPTRGDPSEQGPYRNYFGKLTTEKAMSLLARFAVTGTRFQRRAWRDLSFTLQQDMLTCFLEANRGARQFFLLFPLQALAFLRYLRIMNFQFAKCRNEEMQKKMWTIVQSAIEGAGQFLLFAPNAKRICNLFQDIEHLGLVVVQPKGLTEGSKVADEDDEEAVQFVQERLQGTKMMELLSQLMNLSLMEELKGKDGGDSNKVAIAAAMDEEEEVDDVEEEEEEDQEKNLAIRILYMFGTMQGRYDHLSAEMQELILQLLTQTLPTISATNLSYLIRGLGKMRMVYGSLTQEIRASLEEALLKTLTRNAFTSQEVAHVVSGLAYMQANVASISLPLNQALQQALITHLPLLDDLTLVNKILPAMVALGWQLAEGQAKSMSSALFIVYAQQSLRTMTNWLQASLTKLKEEEEEAEEAEGQAKEGKEEDGDLLAWKNQLLSKQQEGYRTIALNTMGSILQNICQLTTATTSSSSSSLTEASSQRVYQDGLLKCLQLVLVPEEEEVEAEAAKVGVLAQRLPVFDRLQMIIYLTHLLSSSGPGSAEMIAESVGEDFLAFVRPYLLQPTPTIATSSSSSKQQPSSSRMLAGLQGSGEKAKEFQTLAVILAAIEADQLEADDNDYTAKKKDKKNHLATVASGISELSQTVLAQQLAKLEDETASYTVQRNYQGLQLSSTAMSLLAADDGLDDKQLGEDLLPSMDYAILLHGQPRPVAFIHRELLHPPNPPSLPSTLLMTTTLATPPATATPGGSLCSMPWSIQQSLYRRLYPEVPILVWQIEVKEKEEELAEQCQRQVIQPLQTILQGEGSSSSKKEKKMKKATATTTTTTAAAAAAAAAVKKSKKAAATSTSTSTSSAMLFQHVTAEEAVIATEASMVVHHDQVQQQQAAPVADIAAPVVATSLTVTIAEINDLMISAATMKAEQEEGDEDGNLPTMLPPPALVPLEGVSLLYSPAILTTLTTSETPRETKIRHIYLQEFLDWMEIPRGQPFTLKIIDDKFVADTDDDKVRQRKEKLLQPYLGDDAAKQGATASEGEDMVKVKRVKRRREKAADDTTEEVATAPPSPVSAKRAKGRPSRGTEKQ